MSLSATALPFRTTLGDEQRPTAGLSDFERRLLDQCGVCSFRGGPSGYLEPMENGHTRTLGANHERRSLGTMEYRHAEQREIVVAKSLALMAPGRPSDGDRRLDEPPADEQRQVAWQDRALAESLCRREERVPTALR
jgi:hypothetical protein